MSIRQASPSVALKATLESLREHQYQSAGRSLRQIVKQHHVPSSLFAEREATMPLSIAGLGARISLVKQEFETAVGFVKFIESQSDAQTMSDTTFDIVSGLLDIASPTSLSCAATILTSVPPTKLSPALVGLLYKAGLDQPDIIQKVWIHCKVLPDPAVVVVLLERLVRDKMYSDAINVLGNLLKGHDRDSEHLPSTIPIQLAPNLLTYGIRAGATDQCLQIYGQASRQVGALPNPEERAHSPLTIEQKLFYGNPRMTIALVRHLVKLSEKRADKLQGWHRALIKGNPRFFLKNAEQIYASYAAVHGFDKFDLPVTERDTALVRASHHHITTAVACLFELDRFTPALDLFYTLFELKEPPDTHDLGIILASLARRNTGRAIQMLLDVAPVRIPGFRPTPHLYSIVIHQSLKIRKMDEAIKLLEHARGAGCGSLDPVVLDDFIRASLKDITYSWRRGSPGSNHPLTSDELKVMTDERLRSLARILDTFRLLGTKANVPTVRRAIEVAIEIRQARIAWDIRVWGEGVGIFGRKYTHTPGDGKGTKEQADEGKSSVLSICRSLRSLHQRGLMDKSELWSKMRALGVGTKSVERRVDIEDEDGAVPVSLRNQVETVP
ncbi:unnamed protein product [Rhizoctonia solani]|uniref:Uncharacterized protein n=1 Tax=Rhizoctonia solani TaxID=456999 RepID=A0A8H3A0A7_9AGAM|nr:unnamed protein product [Rhizoctonia solani]